MDKELLEKAQAVMRQAAPEPAVKAEPAELEPEPLAAQILADNEPNEVTQILDVWQRVFGMKLDRERVARHLAMLANWQSRNKE